MYEKNMHKNLKFRYRHHYFHHCFHTLVDKKISIMFCSFKKISFLLFSRSCRSYMIDIRHMLGGSRYKLCGLVEPVTELPKSAMIAVGTYTIQ